MTRGLVIGFVFVLVMVSFVSANVELTIKSVTLEEPMSGVISGKDSISIKAVITNQGKSDLNSPFWVRNYVNNKMYGSCFGECELNYDIPVSQGLKAGQSGEIFWGGWAGDKEWLSIGENEVKFVVGVEGESETSEKSIKFTIEENTLPILDLEIADVGVEVFGDRLIWAKALVKNNGPLILEDDVIQVGFSITSKDDGKNYGYYGGFIDLRKDFCVVEEGVEDCLMNVDETMIYSREEGFEKLNSLLKEGNYLAEFYLDDINGLKNYEDINKDNNKRSFEFSIGEAEINPLELVYDQDSNINMEKMVKDRIDSIRRELQVCYTNCDNLPQPKISLDNGDKASTYTLYLNDKEVKRYLLLLETSNVQVIDNSQNSLVLNEYNNYETSGTNSVIFLISEQGEYLVNRYDLLVPNQETKIKYQVVKKEGEYGSVYFFILENDGIFDMDKIINDFDDISQANSNLAGLNEINPYYVMVMPTILNFVMGGEGNFYMGNNLMSLNYGGEKYYKDYDNNVLIKGFSHEYSHGIEGTADLWVKYDGDNSFLMEGLANAISVFNGYKTWEEAMIYDAQISPGCSHLDNLHAPHTLGGCIFKHLEQEGYLTENFFYRLINPNIKENIVLQNCEPTLQNIECTDSLNKIISLATGEDMTSFMKEKLLANVSSQTSSEILGSIEGNTNNIEGDKCSNLGYRKSGEYCSDNLEFISQLDSGNSCENNFECKSNVCVSGECISEGLIKKILNWFKRLFGGE